MITDFILHCKHGSNTTTLFMLKWYLILINPTLTTSLRNLLQHCSSTCSLQKSVKSLRPNGDWDTTTSYVRAERVSGYFYFKCYLFLFFFFFMWTVIFFPFFILSEPPVIWVLGSGIGTQIAKIRALNFRCARRSLETA